MPAIIQIDQAGLPAGVAGFARTDGLATGALVTLESTGGGATARFELLWAPPDDTTAVASLVATGPTTWTFSPDVAVYGTYRILLVVNEGLPTESRQIRCFVIRTPNRGLIIPAANEVADPSATILTAGATTIDRSEQNEPFAPFALGSSWGWWRALSEAIMAADNSGGGVPDPLFQWDGTLGQFGAPITGGGITAPALALAMIGTIPTLQVSMGPSPAGAFAFWPITDPIAYQSMRLRWSQLTTVGAPGDSCLFGLGVASAGIGSPGPTALGFIAGPDGAGNDTLIMSLGNGSAGGALFTTVSVPTVNRIFLDVSLNAGFTNQAGFPPNGIPIYMGTGEISSGVSAKKAIGANPASFAGPEWGVDPTDVVGLFMITTTGVVNVAGAAAQLNSITIDPITGAVP